MKLMLPSLTILILLSFACDKDSEKGQEPLTVDKDLIIGKWATNLWYEGVENDITQYGKANLFIFTANKVSVMSLSSELNCSESRPYELKQNIISIEELGDCALAPDSVDTLIFTNKFNWTHHAKS